MSIDVPVGGELAALQNVTDITKGTIKDTNVIEETNDEESDVNEETSNDAETNDELDETDEIAEDSSDETIDGEEDEVELDENDSIYAKLKALDPTILKKVPELREILFREKELTKYFLTVDDAKQASDIVDTFHTFERNLSDGDSSNLIEALDKSKSLDKFAANFLPSLQEHSQDKYMQMMYPEFKKMLRVAINSGNEALALSAKNLHWFIFNNTNVEEHAGYKSDLKKSDKELSLEEKERQLVTKQAEYFGNDVQAGVDKRLNKIIAKSLENTGLKPFVLKAVTEKIITEIYSQATKDSRHQGNMSSLWSQAKRAGFTPDWKDRISLAALSRAKGLLPNIRKEVLIEAGITPSSKVNTKQPIRVVPGNASSSSVSNRPKPKDVDWGKTSELDMLQGKAPVLKTRK